MFKLGVCLCVLIFISIINLSHPNQNVLSTDQVMDKLRKITNTTDEPYYNTIDYQGYKETVNHTVDEYQVWLKMKNAKLQLQLIQRNTGQIYQGTYNYDDLDQKLKNNLQDLQQVYSEFKTAIASSEMISINDEGTLKWRIIIGVNNNRREKQIVFKTIKVNMAKGQLALELIKIKEKQINELKQQNKQLKEQMNELRLNVQQHKNKISQLATIINELILKYNQTIKQIKILFPQTNGLLMNIVWDSTTQYYKNFKVNTNEKKVQALVNDQFNQIVSNESIPQQGRYLINIRVIKTSSKRIKFGIVTNDVKSLKYSFEDAQSLKYQGDGYLYYDGTSKKELNTISNDVLVTVAVDMNEKVISWYLNGAMTVSHPLHQRFIKKKIYFCIEMYNSGDTIQLV